MENNFKNLGKGVNAPKDLKGEVFKSLETFQLVADILDLFTTKYTLTELELINLASKTNPEENDDFQTSNK
jgi:hypothetical protein